MRAATKQLSNLINLDLRPRDTVTAEAIDHAFAYDMAMGDSTNTVLHTITIVREIGVASLLARLNEISARVPIIWRVPPSSSYHDEDAGVSAIL